MISVIIPTYNCHNYLYNSLESLSRQARLPDEVIVIDDGSTGQDAKMNRRYAAHFGAIYHKLENNQGANKARNIGFDVAIGEMVIFCDSDCVYMPTFLDDLEQALLAQRHAPFAYCDFLREDEDKVVKHYISGYFSHARLKQGNYIDTSSLIRRTAFPYFDAKLKRLQDWDIWLQITGKTPDSPVYVQKTLYRNILREDSISRTEDHQKAKEYIIKKHNL